jgi:hypothetical protein
VGLYGPLIQRLWLVGQTSLILLNDWRNRPAMIIGDFAPVPSMTVHNADIAKLFNRLADLLEIEEANPFRVRAFRRVAETIEALPQDVAQLVAAGEDVSELPGIGEDLAVELKVIVDMGRLKLPPTGSAHQSRLRTVPASCRGRWRANARWLLGRQPRLRRQRRGAG